MATVRPALSLLGVLTAAPLCAAEEPPNIRVGNLANKGELARFERRVWEACGHEADIRIERRASAAKPGRVIAQYPPKGTRVGCNDARATLTLSAGPPDARIFVPALVEPARRRAFVRQLRTACGAAIPIMEIRRASRLPEGRFLGQAPAQGTRYRCGAPLEVILSAGPRAGATRPEPRPAPRKALPPEQPRPAPPPEAPPPQVPPEVPTPAPDPQPNPAEPPPAPPTPAAPDQPNLRAPFLLLPLLAALLAALLWRRRPGPPPARPVPVAPVRTRPQPPVATLLTLDHGWPRAEARLVPLSRLPVGPPADLLPPVPLLRDLLRPLDPLLELIAQTPLAVLGGTEPRPGDAETLAHLHTDFARALGFALLFELPPLLARAWAAAPALPFATQPRRGWCPLAPNSIEISVTPDLRLRLAGIPVLRPCLAIRLRLTFTEARLFLRGTALDAFEPGATQVAAAADWAGRTHPLAVLRPHAEWPGSQAQTPPLQLRALAPGRLCPVA